MILAWLALSCVSPGSVERSGVIVCPAPERRGVLEFDLKQSFQTSLSRAELHGGGLLVADLDGDGWLDLFAPGESEHLLRWTRPGAPAELFDVADDTLSSLPLDHAVGATAVDIEGDGDLDLFVPRWERPHTLLRNEGGRRFTDVSASAFPTPSASRSQSASWGDIDGDGDLDLFVGTYGERVTIDVTEPTPDCSDHRPDDAQLWRNNGDGTFTDDSDQLPAVAHGYTFMSGFYDLEDDGYPELFLAHDDGICGPSALLWNHRGTFTVDDATGFDRGTHDMGMGVGDLNDDTLPDFLLTSWNGADLLLSSRTDGQIRWIEASAARALVLDSAPRDRPSQAQPGQQIFGWGAELADIDNDADLDALMVFGYWHYFQGPANEVRQRDGYWVQHDDGTFEDQATRVGLAEPLVTRSVVAADLNGDGYLDVVKHALDEGIPLHLSRCGTAAWVRIRLQDDGPNRFGVGARIEVEAGGTRHTRWITSGSTGMYTGSPLEAHVGLGEAEHIDRITVHWPDGGTTRVTNEEARQRLTIRR